MIRTFATILLLILVMDQSKSIDRPKPKRVEARGYSSPAVTVYTPKTRYEVLVDSLKQEKLWEEQ